MRRTLLDEGLVRGHRGALADGHTLRHPRDEHELGAGRHLVARDDTEEGVETLAGHEVVNELSVAARAAASEGDGVHVTAVDIVSVSERCPGRSERAAVGGSNRGGNVGQGGHCGTIGASGKLRPTGNGELKGM